MAQTSIEWRRKAHEIIDRAQRVQTVISGFESIDMDNERAIRSTMSRRPSRVGRESQPDSLAARGTPDAAAVRHAPIAPGTARLIQRGGRELAKALKESP